VIAAVLGTLATTQAIPVSAEEGWSVSGGGNGSLAGSVEAAPDGEGDLLTFHNHAGLFRIEQLNSHSANFQPAGLSVQAARAKYFPLMPDGRTSWLFHRSDDRSASAKFQASEDSVEETTLDISYVAVKAILDLALAKVMEGVKAGRLIGSAKDVLHAGLLAQCVDDPLDTNTLIALLIRVSPTQAAISADVQGLNFGQALKDLQQALPDVLAQIKGSVAEAFDAGTVSASCNDLDRKDSIKGAILDQLTGLAPGLFSIAATVAAHYGDVMWEIATSRDVFDGASTAFSFTNPIDGAHSGLDQNGACTGWNLFVDFKVNSDHANPSPDHCQNEGVWSYDFLEIPSLARRPLETFGVLPSSAPRALPAWIHGRTSLGPNRSGSDVRTDLEPALVPAHDVLIRERDGDQPGVTWTSPVSGKVALSGSIRNVTSSACPGGEFIWQIYRGSELITSGFVKNGKSNQFETQTDGAALAAIDVGVGSQLRLVMSASLGCADAAVALDISPSDVTPPSPQDQLTSCGPPSSLGRWDLGAPFVDAPEGPPAVRSIAAAKDGSLWFTVGGFGAASNRSLAGHISPDGKLTTVPLVNNTTGFGTPDVVVVTDQGGNAWFVADNGGRSTILNASGVRISTIAIPTTVGWATPVFGSDGALYGPTTSSDGRPALVKATLAGAVNRVDLGVDATYRSLGLAASRDGSIWTVMDNTIDTPSPTDPSHLSSRQGPGLVVALHPDGTITKAPISKVPKGWIAEGPDGRIWAVEGDDQQSATTLVRVSPGGAVMETPNADVEFLGHRPVALASDGTRWAGTMGGIIALLGTGKLLTAPTPDLPDDLGQLAPGAAGTLWAAPEVTSDRGYIAHIRLPCSP
jgi:hypothetical protein